MVILITDGSRCGRGNRQFGRSYTRCVLSWPAAHRAQILARSPAAAPLYVLFTGFCADRTPVPIATT